MTMHYLVFLKGNLRWQMEVSYLVGIKKKSASTSGRLRSLPGLLNSATRYKNAFFATTTALKICSG